MSNLTRTLIIGVTLAAMHLVGMAAVAHAQANDEPVMQPPTERQVGEAWRQPGTAEEPTVAGDARRPPTEAEVGESWRHPTGAPVRSAEPSGQPGWLVASLAVLIAAVALSGGLAVLAARRTRRRARLGHAA